MGRFKLKSPAQMLAELESGCLEVVLIPAPDPQFEGHQIRAVQYANCEWYREFCGEFVSCTGKRTRPRTYIKRANTIRALERIIKGETKGIYVERLLKFISFHLRQQAARKRMRKIEKRNGGGGDCLFRF